jgi:signal transduction histidine kinase
MVHFVAHHNFHPEQLVRWQQRFPRAPGGGIGRVIETRGVVCVADVQSGDGAVFGLAARELMLAHGTHSALLVPMSRNNAVIGVITLTHRRVGAFTESHVELLKTFADQAVIAIENVRLFKELEERNQALSEALEQQTTTSDILGVISRSPTEVGPVLAAVAESAARLCTAVDAIILRTEGPMMRRVAHFGDIASVSDVRSVTRDTPSGRAIVESQIIHIEDILEEFARGEYLEARALQEGSGFRTVLVVPLMREGAVVGVINIRRLEVRAFTAKQIALVKTFADQAVIAIENVRLFKELQEKNLALTEAHAQVTEALEQQTATAEILRVISRSQTDVQPVFDTIVRSAVKLCDGFFSQLFQFDGELIHQVAQHNFTPEALEAVHRVYPVRPSRAHGSARAILERRVVHIPDVEVDPEYQHQAVSRAVGFRSGLWVPMLREGAPIGVIAVTRAEPGQFSDNEIELLKTFADQAVIAIENVRLFKELQARNREIEDKSAQLEVASQHKSEFLANMSHELRTPLNAIIGFSEVLTERMFGDLNEKQAEYLKDIHASGSHLLSLINDILDLSKIEAGRMELELTDFDLPMAIDNALTLVRERASRRGIRLESTTDKQLGMIGGDERKVKQVLLNLLSNALKFTPEGGRVEVLARVVDGMAEISVTDTGVGIAPEDHEAVFEEFRQVGTAEKKAEGTGLGLALTRKFTELHGGKIWVQSEVGRGSTFTFTIPVRLGE